MKSEREKCSEERELEREVDDLLMSIVVCDAENKPGAFIKRWGHKFKNLDKLKARHFNHRVKGLL